MASSIVVNILGNASNFISATNSAQSGMDKWAARAGKAGLAIGGALAGAATAAVKSAADQSAAISAWTQVTNKQMDAQQQSIARSLNLSQADYAKSYTTLSALYQSNGIAQAEANKMAAAGLKTAADAAAFGNTTVGEAVEAQAGLLKGSGELWEKYSVSIKASDVADRVKEARIKGLTAAQQKQWASLSKLEPAERKLLKAKLEAAMPSEKATEATVRYALSQEKAALFLGQATKESSSLESRQQKLAATVEDFKAKLGTGLLPIVEKFVGKLQSAAEWVAANETKTKIFVGVLAGFAAVCLTVVGVVKTIALVQKAWNAVMIATNVIMFANPITLVVVALVALAAGLVIAYKKSETFREIIDKAMRAVRNVTIDVIKFVVDKFLWYAETILWAASKAFGWVPGLGGKLKRAHAAIKKFRDDTNATLEGLKDHSINIKLTASQQAFNAAYKASPQGKAGQLGPFVPSNPTSNTSRGRSVEGARANGGPVRGGGMYLVGERGPELFVPKSGGTIVPNGAGGGATTIALTINMHDEKGALRKTIREIVRTNGGTADAAFARG